MLQMRRARLLFKVSIAALVQKMVNVCKDGMRLRPVDKLSGFLLFPFRREVFIRCEKCRENICKQTLQHDSFILKVYLYEYIHRSLLLRIFEQLNSVIIISS